MTEAIANEAPDAPAARLMALAGRNRRDLHTAFAAATSAPSVPNGPTDGLCLPLPGTLFCRPLALFFRLFWRGKIFDRASAGMINRVLPMDLRAIPAYVTVEASRIDGKPCIAIDYKASGPLGRHVRDELREIEPRLFLGVMLIAGRPVLRFALATAAPS